MVASTLDEGGEDFDNAKAVECASFVQGELLQFDTSVVGLRLASSKSTAGVNMVLWMQLSSTMRVNDGCRVDCCQGFLLSV